MQGGVFLKENATQHRFFRGTTILEPLYPGPRRHTINTVLKKAAMNTLATLDQGRRIPEPQGLYHPQNEHDACGMGLVASIRGEKSHDIIRKGIEVLINLTHRGACGLRSGDRRRRRHPDPDSS